MYPNLLDTSKFLHPEGCDFHKELDNEYEFPVSFEEPPVILDIGACCGAFAVWASARWPGAIVHSYEPIPHNFNYLLKNRALYEVVGACVNAAVVPAKFAHAKMLHGLYNCGTYSFFDVGEQDPDYLYTVQTIFPEDLPTSADVLKIDTEGMEIEILQHLKEIPPIVMLEYHRPDDRFLIYELLVKKGFQMWCHEPTWKNRGIMKFIDERKAVRLEPEPPTPCAVSPAGSAESSAINPRDYPLGDEPSHEYRYNRGLERSRDESEVSTMPTADPSLTRPEILKESRGDLTTPR